MPTVNNSTFLTAEWKNLIVINYQVNPVILQHYIPRGTEIDLFNGHAFISLVAFCFNKNKLWGIIPSFPYNFEEINLRFYVKRTVDGITRRGVVFIKEVVPSKLIASTARILYNEPYTSLKTRYTATTTSFAYSWEQLHEEYKIEADIKPDLLELKPGSFEEFVLEHYWGYTDQKNGKTFEYQVKHPRWNYWETTGFATSPNIKNFYDPVFKPILTGEPHSAFVAQGSAISVSTPSKIFHPLLPATPLGWVLYDGKCGFCSWWIPFWGNSIRKTGYDFTSVQDTWVKEKLNLSDDQLNNDIRLLLNDGSLINGADAYIYGMQQVWWCRPIGLLLSWPILREITHFFYRIFNRNRFLVSRICKLKSVDES